MAASLELLDRLFSDKNLTSSQFCGTQRNNLKQGNVRVGSKYEMIIDSHWDSLGRKDCSENKGNEALVELHIDKSCCSKWTC